MTPTNTEGNFYPEHTCAIFTGFVQRRLPGRSHAATRLRGRLGKILASLDGASEFVARPAIDEGEAASKTEGENVPREIIDCIRRVSIPAADCAAELLPQSVKLSTQPRRVYVHAWPSVSEADAGAVSVCVRSCITRRCGQWQMFARNHEFRDQPGDWLERSRYNNRGS